LKYREELDPTEHLHLVGWEDNPNKPVEKAILKRAEELGISATLTIHGRKQIGEELNSMYRMADIYVLPSHHEGFPRTIWEAMANCLPVITTPVGAIPERLRNNVHAKFVTPYEVSELADVIKLVISDKLLRRNLISEGYKLAAVNTLEKQIPELIRELL
jgi:glycosyltransferase involved in cell wall biosynthesis